MKTKLKVLVLLMVVSVVLLIVARKLSVPVTPGKNADLLTQDKTAGTVPIPEILDVPVDKETLESVHQTEIDLVIFMGQSNMSGRGDYTQAPALISGAGYEFRAITNPNTLYPIGEPFGYLEDNPNGLYEPMSKTGSCVTAFVNSYYQNTGVPIVGVAASKGATGIVQWVPGTAYFNDALNRYGAARTWLEGNGYKIRHKYMVWLQGEYDAAVNTPPADYVSMLKSIMDEFQKNGVEKCMVMRIGDTSENDALYDTIISTQTELCRTDPDFVLISVQAASFVERGLMRDIVHYTQEGYNIIGEEAGRNMAYYTNTGEEPSMEDPEYGTQYVPAN